MQKPQKMVALKHEKATKTSPLSLKNTFHDSRFSLLTGSALFLYFIKDLPWPEVFTESEISQVTKIYDRKGEIVLSSVYGEEKEPMSPCPTSLTTCKKP